MKRELIGWYLVGLLLGCVFYQAWTAPPIDYNQRGAQLRNEMDRFR